MAKRNIVRIDEDLCTGCGECVIPCAEGAIEIIDGKARVVREELCDGAGFCIGICPEGALSIEVREAPDFDLAVAERRAEERQRGERMRQACCLCGADEMKAPLFPMRRQGRSEWVCARCLPHLIHG